MRDSIWKNSIRARGVIGVCLLCLLNVAVALGGEQMRAPREEVGKGKKVVSTTPRGGALKGLMGFFRTTISPVDGNRCPMYPTCSQYGERALAKHGSILGLLMIVDRLFHEWSETKMAQPIWVHGVQRYWDPVNENDFWFTGKDARADRSTPGAGAP